MVIALLIIFNKFYDQITLQKNGETTKTKQFY